MECRCLNVISTCAANGSYTVLIERESTADCLLPHVFVELVTAGEVEKRTVKLVTRQQSVSTRQTMSSTRVTASLV